jgi:hypothetical protein
MSDDPFAERLSRFTPAAAGLDRDALLFNAGRASARPARRWQALAGVLAAAQLVTLALLLWPRPALPVPVPSFPAEVAPVAIEQPPAPPARQAPALLALRDRALATEGNLPAPAAVKPLVPPAPPLHAFGAPPPDLLH